MSQQQSVIRTERFWLKPCPVLSKLCHLSKNLFNEANYLVRQPFFSDGVWIKGTELEEKLKDSINFNSLPLTTSLRILVLVEKAWKAFFNALADWKLHPEKYFQKPRPPKYKQKNGEFTLPIGKEQIKVRKRILTLFGDFHVKLRFSSIQSIIGVRINPQGIGYVLEVLYTKNVPKTPRIKPKRVIGIDIGLANLITMVNNIGRKPIVVKGGVARSINQFYNKEQARLQSLYDKQNLRTIGKKLRKLTDKRNRKLNHYFHEVSHFVVNWCTKNKIDTIIIGRNKLWKQHVKLGKRGNQNFVTIPFSKLIKKIEYKAQDTGIRTILIREDYTSKCSFLDQEPIIRHSAYVGERITRGLFQASTGEMINSDVNGGYNIIKKAVPNAFTQWETIDGIEGVWLHPVRWKTNGQPMVT